MGWSGFCTKLAEVFDRHLGNLSRPSQIVKEAAAQGDAMRLLAAAERDGEMIRRGELDIEVPPGLSRVSMRAPQPAQQQLTYGQQIGARIVHQELKHEQNLEKIAYYATEEEGDGNVAHDRDPDEEWLTQFFKNAQDVSTEQLQRLWARLLAGEVRSPGSYTIDTIDFLRRMTSHRAQEIQKIGPFIFFNEIIAKCEYIENQEWNSFDFWLELDNLGVINRDISTQFHSSDLAKYEQAFVYGAKVLVCRRDTVEPPLHVDGRTLTTLGREVLSLGKFEPDYAYLISLAREIKTQSFSVHLADLVEGTQEGMIKGRNLTEVT